MWAHKRKRLRRKPVKLEIKGHTRIPMSFGGRRTGVARSGISSDVVTRLVDSRLQAFEKGAQKNLLEDRQNIQQDVRGRFDNLQRGLQEQGNIISAFAFNPRQARLIRLLNDPNVPRVERDDIYNELQESLREQRDGPGRAPGGNVQAERPDVEMGDAPAPPPPPPPPPDEAMPPAPPARPAPPAPPAPPDPPAPDPPAPDPPAPDAPAPAARARLPARRVQIPRPRFRVNVRNPPDALVAANPQPPDALVAGPQLNVPLRLFNRQRAPRRAAEDDAGGDQRRPRVVGAMPQMPQLGNDQPGALVAPPPPAPPGNQINYMVRYDDDGQATGRARINPVESDPPPRVDDTPTVEA
jgi:hypothetical protein